MCSHYAPRCKRFTASWQRKVSTTTHRGSRWRNSTSCGRLRGGEQLLKTPKSTCSRLLFESEDILMTTPTPTPPQENPIVDPPRQKARDEAIAYCQQEIDFYGKTGSYNHRRWKWSQIATIVLGAIATVLASVQSERFKTEFLIARSVAIAATTIAAGYNSSFSFQKESVRQWATSDLLQGELVKLRTYSIPYDQPETAVSEFVNRIREIISAENRTWVSASLITPPRTTSEIMPSGGRVDH